MREVRLRWLLLGAYSSFTMGPGRVDNSPKLEILVNKRQYKREQIKKTKNKNTNFFSNLDKIQPAIAL